MTSIPKHGEPRAWQRMLSGRRLDLLAPEPSDVAIEDIAHGLARVARWNGQTRGAHAFSVAQHSLLVERIAGVIDPTLPGTDRLAVLLHDAPEYVIGDLISPFKAAIGVDYKAFERRLLAAIHARFSIASPLPVLLTDAIKRADRIAAYYEATVLAGFSADEARLYFGEPATEALGHLAAELGRIVPVPAGQAQAEFLTRFHALFRAA